MYESIGKIAELTAKVNMCTDYTADLQYRGETGFIDVFLNDSDGDKIVGCTVIATENSTEIKLQLDGMANVLKYHIKISE